MKKFILRITVFACLTFGSQSIFAADGSSGCGPGWYIFKKNSLVSSLLRGTTNGMLAPVVTIGMTFGTSNCSKHSIVLRDKEVERFVAYNFQPFRYDSAMGTGSHIDAVSDMYQCDFIGSANFQREVQANFEYLFENKSSYNVTQKLNDIVYYNDDINSHCQTI